MHKSADFLVEIGTEELPPKEIERLAISFKDEICNLLTTKKISFGSDPVYFGTPRRLAVYIKDVATQQEQQVNSRLGPLISAAYDANGKPTQAALGFAKSCGIDLAQASKVASDKGDKLFYEETVPGQDTSKLLPNIVEEALKKLPIKKYMRWGTGAVAFVRPVHWIVMLYGKDVVPGTIFGINTGNISFGHRILSATPITITAPANYEKELEQQGKIIPSLAKRQANILAQIQNLASKANASAVIEPELLKTVTGLVEHPVALLAGFDPAFLRVPKECLISSMQDHQKCFALMDKDGKLLPQFILISNISSTDPKTIVHGNELVMHARLADAAFYFDKDQKQTLATRREQLKEVIYVKKLGSIYDKTERIKKLARYMADQYFKNIDHAKVERAAELCKADLLTSMVYEFPELQGIMGCYYALHDNEAKEVAVAIKEHYQPRFAEDALPDSVIGIIIALADRIDTIVGMFGIGNFPTGEKDPYALRRQAIAILKIILDKQFNMNLKDLISFASLNYPANIVTPSKEYFEFFSDRLKSWYLSAGVPAQTIASVMATVSNEPWPPQTANDRDRYYLPADIDKRIKAVQHFQMLPAAVSLAAANKRVQNLLEKNTTHSGTDTSSINVKLLAANEEQHLYQAITNKEQEIAPLLKNQDYTAILQSLAALQTPVDAFFDHVMVMDEDLAKRTNRLNLLKSLRNLFLKVADVSLL